jgi:hypothetical protein
MSKVDVLEDSTDASPGFYDNANAQSASPLFSLLPLEMRAEIFALALSALPDESQPWPFDSYWYRPGYTAPKRTEVSVLLLCKRAYREARELVWKAGGGNDEETFWWGDPDRRPHEYAGPSSFFHEEFEMHGLWEEGDWDDLGGDESSGEANAEHLQVEGGGELEPDHESGGALNKIPTPQDEAGARLLSTSDSDIVVKEATVDPSAFADPREDHIIQFLQNLPLDVKSPSPDSPLQSHRQQMFTPVHWSKITAIHIFSQMHAFSRTSFLRTFIQAKGLRPHTVKVTIPFTDVWNWEVNAPLDLVSAAPEAQAYGFPESVNTYVIELEAAEHKKCELETVVKQLVDDKKIWKWKRLDDECLELDKDVGIKEWEWMGTTEDRGQFSQDAHGDIMKYIVKVLTLTARPAELEWDGTPFDRALAIKTTRQASFRNNKDLRTQSNCIPGLHILYNPPL